MSDFEKRVQINKIIESQLPEFIVSDFPKATEFFKQYYISQEYQGGNVDIVENLDQYLKLDNLVPEVINGSTTLRGNISSSDTIINVETTKGFPSEYGLLKIDDEIITYTGITTNTFVGCVRGFSGISEYSLNNKIDLNQINNENLIFSTSKSSSHSNGSNVINLSVLFLQEFYKKLKYTFAPGFENIDFVSDLDVGNFLKNIRQFYQSKGIDESIKILFKVLYGEDVLVLNLEQYLIKPSFADFIRREVIVCDHISGGNPLNLKGQTIFKSTDLNINAAVSEIEVFTRNNKLYYKISLYPTNREGELIEGTFSVPGKTKVLENVSAGSSVISVDSTIGFGQTGSIISENNDIINYTSKSVNQFFGCSGIVKDIPSASDIVSDEFVFGYENGDLSKKVTLRITGVLSKFVSENDIALSDENEVITVKNIGEIVKNPSSGATYKEVFANSWIYNTSSRYQIKNIAGSTFTLSSLIDKSSLREGDTVDILQRNTNIVAFSNAIVSIINSSLNQIILNNISGFIPNSLLEYDIRRKLKKANSGAVQILNGNNVYISDILNVYFEKNLYGYIASNSLPGYTITKNIIESSIPVGTGSYLQGYSSVSNLYSIISFDNNVSFIDGDSLLYTASNKSLPGLTSGNYYYVKLINNNQIRLYNSRHLAIKNNYVEFDKIFDPGTHTFTLKKHSGRVLYPNNILRKFPLSQNLHNKNIKRRIDGNIGVMVDGVEIISPESTDKIYYGPLENFEVLNGGEDYDIINPPRISISSGDGTTSLVDPIIIGSVKKIFVDPQNFEIDKVISLSLTGGNGSGCILEPIIGEKYREIEFDSRDVFNGGGIDIIEETITFTRDHNLKDGDSIIYDQNGNDPIGIGSYQGSNIISSSSLVSRETYIAKYVNNKTIKLYNRYSDYNAGINTIGFSTNTTSSGIHKFRTLSTKTLKSISVINGGSGYQYRKLRVKPSGISTITDTVVYKNHGFNSGEIVNYYNETSIDQSTPIPISGLSTSNQYYIIKIDNDSFRIADAGIGASITSNYIRNNHIKFESSGSGYHVFKYPDIKVNINVSYGSTSTGDFVFTPVVTGVISDAYLYESGSGYGSTVINLKKNPVITIKNGKESQLTPNIINGSITHVNVVNGGYEYTSIPELVVEGIGNGAILKPTIENEKIVNVIVVNGGIGYDPKKTSIRVIPRGSGAIFNTRIRSLTLNDGDRFKEVALYTNDNYLSYGLYGYSEDLGKNVYSDTGNIHSPIVGWAYDGNPIYGPYGYEDANNNQSRVKLLSPSYSLDVNRIESRPTFFKPGFFIEDYYYDGSGDLDEYNGRFCKTPEFPNGVYAYFVGVTTSLLTNKLEARYPYFIGKYYRSELIEENLILNQSYDFNSSNLSRNTYPYKIRDLYANNDFINEPIETHNQRSVIESISIGSIDSIEVLDGGNGYRVNDFTRFDDTGTGGIGLQGQVEEIQGKSISKISTELDRYENVVFVWNSNQTVSAYYKDYFGFNNGDGVTVSGLSTSVLQLEKSFSIGISSDIIGLGKSISSNLNPDGIIEDIYVSKLADSISIGSSIKIEDETLKVLNIYPTQSILRVKRLGIGSSHALGSQINILSNKIDIPTKVVNKFDSRVNKKVYFNGNQSVGIGTTLGITIDTTYTIGELSKNISIPTRSIYLPDHPFKTGEEVTLTKSTLPGVSAFIVGNDATGSNTFLIPDILTNTSTAYVINKSKDYIGLTTRIDLTTNSDGLYFYSNGSNNSEYALESKYNQVTGTVDRIITTVTTENPHNLLNKDVVDLTVVPTTVVGMGTTAPLTLVFDENTESILVNPVGFNSSRFNTLLDTISIPSHGYKTGDKVFYSSKDEVASGLTTGSYYVLRVDSDTFKLCETYFDTQSLNPNLINITGIGGTQHYISLINPQINVVKNSILTFNVSDSSLIGKKLKIFYDKDFKNEFNSTKDNSSFSVSSDGIIGFGTASLSIKYSSSIPSKLYYALEKSGSIISADNEVYNYSEINFVNSNYTGTYNVFGITTSTFNISPPIVPEVLSYQKNECEILEYSTKSPSVSGPIKSIKILSKGFNYKKLPEFISVESINGINANLIAISTSIGKIKNVRIIDIGYEYSADRTLRPEAYISPIVKIDNLDTIEAINIVDGGKNYINPPNLLLYNTKSKSVIDSTSLEAKVPNSTISSVEIVGQIYGLESAEHRLISINNSNGIGISSITSSGLSGIVTCILSTPILGFSATNDIFKIGDDIFVEGIELYDPNSGTGYNSSDYDYRFFKVSSFINTNPAKLEFNLVDDNGVGLTTNPGIAKTFQSGYASIINAKNYPIFQVIQKRSLFIENEPLFVDEGAGFIQRDLYISAFRKDFIKIKGKYDIKVNQRIKGKISGTIATITEISENKAKFEINSSNKKNYGWTDNTGKLSEDYQVIPDNDYYQNLSYSVKSTIPYERFINPLNSIVHPVGLKNFGDVGIVSSVSAISSHFGETNNVIILDIIDEKRTDSINNFDLTLDYDTRIEKSKYLKIKNKKLTDYTKCKTNRVLLHDDISDKFSSKGQQDTFTEIEEIVDNFSRYLVQVVDPDTLECQLSDLIVLTTTDDAILVQKSNVFSNIELGSFSAEVDSFERKSINFIPTDPFDRDHNLKVLKNTFNTDINGQGARNIGFITLSSSNIGVSSIGVSAGSSIGTIIDYDASDFQSLFANIQIQNTITKKINYVDVVVDFDGNDTYLGEYYFDSSSPFFSTDKIGIITSSYNNVSGKIELKIQNDQNQSLLVRSNIVKLSDTSLGIGTYRFSVPGQPDGAERSARLESTFDVGISTVRVATLNSLTDSSLKSLIKVSCGQTSALHQVSLVHNTKDIFINQGPYVSVGNTSGIGTFGGVYDGSNLYLNFYPDSEFNSTVTVQSYNEVLYTTNDFENETTNLIYGPQSQSILLSVYDGINGTRANKVDFDLRYKKIPIYVKTFNPSDLTQVDPVTGIFTIPNHFYNTGEELIYKPGSTFIGVGQTSVGIGSTANYIGIVTDRLPEKVYPIVINENQFRLSTRQSYANAGIYVTFTNYGLGNAHKLEMTKKLEKTVISLDGIIQQPITYTPISHTLQFNGGYINAGISTFALSGISSIQPRDLLKIDEEFMQVVEVGLSTIPTGNIGVVVAGVGLTYPVVSVKRSSVGSAATSHDDSTNVQVYRGSFNIVDSKVYFKDSPKGNTRSRRTDTNLPYVRSQYSGRTFLRSDYATNYLFDDISNQFTGVGKTYTLSVQGAGVTGLTVGNGILFINGVFQTPTTVNNPENNYEMISSSGISSVVFTGITSTDGSFIKSDYDINQNQLPRGGLIVSLGSTPGLGYAPLVGAKVRANLSGIGSIISITGISHTGPGQSISTAFYDNQTGIIEITTLTDHNFVGGDRIKLVGLAFTCPSGSGIVSYFPSRGFDYSYDITSIVSNTTFRSQVGTSTIPHTYIGMGTVFPWYDLNYGSGYREPVSIAITDTNHYGTEASISAVVGVGGTLNFIVNDGGSGYVNPYIKIPDPSYSNLPITGVSRLGVGLTSDTGKNLLISLNVGPSNTTGIGSTYFQVSSFNITRPGYGFQVGDKFKPVGLVTSIGLSSPISEFELEVVEVFYDYISSWQFGEMDYIDSVKQLQNGVRKRFPLFYNGQLLSFEIDPLDSLSSTIDLNSVLLIFVNGVIQTPGIAYNFEGGTSFEFTEAPKASDKIDIFFYVGTRGVDVEIVDVMETVKVGDDLFVYKNDNFKSTISQDSDRSIFELSGSDILETNTYVGPGIDENVYRPFEWKKQKVDKIIKGDIVYKSRDSIETQIYPTAKIIGDINVSSTEIFVDDAQFFVYEENNYGININNFEGLIVSAIDPVSAAFTATVSAAGTIQSVNIINSGSGYSNNVAIKISKPKIVGVGLGTVASAIAIVSNGSVISTQIVDGGFGYDQNNPPQVITETPMFENENIKSIENVQGFSGIITGISTTVGTNGHPLALKFFFRANASDATDLQVGYPVYIFDTKVGNGVTSVNSSDSSIVGIGTTFLDNVYIVNSKVNFGPDAEIVCNVHTESSILGINTSNTILNSSIGGISWGRLYNLQRGLNPISIGVTGLIVDSDLSSFPTIQRRGFGLRNLGAIRKLSNI